MKDFHYAHLFRPDNIAKIEELNLVGVINDRGVVQATELSEDLAKYLFAVTRKTLEIFRNVCDDFPKPLTVARELAAAELGPDPLDKLKAEVDS